MPPSRSAQPRPPRRTPIVPAPAAGGLRGRTVVITRPAGTAAALVRLVHAAGGRPVRLPGLSLQRTEPVDDARDHLRQALADDVLLFTSPAAVRFAARLLPLRTAATVLAVGQGTAQALRWHGLQAQAPMQRQDSEGLLAMPALRHLQGRPVALVSAAGGRGLLREQLRARGACLREVHVYRRQPARLDRRHRAALAGLPDEACVLWSSGEALQNLQQALAGPDWQRLCRVQAVVSSGRLVALARAAGFERIRQAASARPRDLLAAAAAG